MSDISATYLQALILDHKELEAEIAAARAELKAKHDAQAVRRRRWKELTDELDRLRGSGLNRTDSTVAQK